MFPVRHTPPGRHGRSPLRLLAAAALVVGVAGFAPHGHTADGPPAAAADVHLARAALSVLDADPGLRDFNLVVSVVDRVAVVGGPVPSKDLRDRAEALVASVPGVRAVRNGCFVQAGGEPLLRPNAVAARPLPQLPPVVLPIRPGATTEAGPPPTGDQFAVAPVVAPGERSVVARRPTTPGANVLLPPLATGPAVAAPVAAYPAGVLTARPSFADAVEAVRRAEPRFAGLRAEFREGATVVVTGTAPKPADAWDLADRIRAIPGVARVAVGPVGR